MEIKKIKVYNYGELSDCSKERARAKFLENSDFYWWSDCEKAIKSFCDHFGVGKLDYSIGAFCPSWIDTNADNSHFKGLKLKDFKDADKLAKTGYCEELNMFDEFYSHWKETGSPLLAFKHALNAGCRSIQKDMEYHQSDEFAEEMIIANDYQFTEDGEFFHYKEAA